MARTEQIERTFSAPSGCHLEVSNITGSITITGEETDQIHIVAVKRYRTQQEAEATEIDIGQEGRRVWARTHIHRKGGWCLWRSRRAANVDYQIKLPCHSQLEVNSVSAIVNVNSIEGQLTISTVSGSVIIGDITGPLHLKTVSGSVQGHRLQGQLHLEIVSGKAKFSDSDFDRIAATTVSGRMSLETILHPAGDYKVRTVSGNVEFIVPLDIHCTIKGRSISGRLNTSLAHVLERQQLGAWQAKIGSGRTPLRFDSVSGNLILTVGERRASTEAISPEDEAMLRPRPEPAAAKSDYDTAMSILEAIEAGQLSVEEGAIRLRELKALARRAL